MLLILHQLLSKTHLLPVLSEAFEEAFQSFAVRLGMIAFTSGELSFNGFDWGQIGQDAVFGGLAGGFSVASLVATRSSCLCSVMMSGVGRLPRVLRMM